MVFQKIQNSLKKLSEKAGFRKPDLNYLDDQDLSRFSDQDIILESENQIQQYLPEVLGQALARTWIDKRFLDAFYKYPVEILEPLEFDNTQLTKISMIAKKVIVNQKYEPIYEEPYVDHSLNNPPVARLKSSP